MRARWNIGVIGVLGALVWLIFAPPSGARAPAQQGTPLPDVFAEAIIQANLRSGPGLEYEVVGEIAAGTRYRVLAQHAYVPWLQLEYGAVSSTSSGAWVYQDLVTVTGSLALVPVLSDFPSLVTATTAPTATLTLLPAFSPTPSPAGLDPAASAATDEPPTLMPTVNGPTVTTLGEANIRFGPGVEYAPIIKVPEGATFRILERHAIFPWLHIALPESPSGSGWVYREIVTINGDLSQVPVTSAQSFGFPTLTPTPPTVIVSGPPWDGAPTASGNLATTLGDAMHNYLLEQGFVPYTEQFGSVFMLDLQSGDTFTLYDNVAFSGMSVTKIAILAAYFQRHSGPLSWDDAFLIADTMMCSENITTNHLLESIGDGDGVRGAQRVTAFLQSLNLTRSFLMSPYLLSPDDEPYAVGTIQTGADQSTARPDISNQVLPRELGWLLAGIYQCAQNETGLLMERYPADFNAQECRQMLAALDANEIGVFIEAGAPPTAQVMHKHGWIGDTHGDAGIVIGPERAYVLVVALYGKDWLQFELSSPVIAELSRMAWNTFNPSEPVASINPRTVPDQCDPRQDPVMDALLSQSLPAPGP